MKEGQFPNYSEPKITFLPTYKLEKKELKYKEKNDQAPSFTDRILFKNNSSFETVDDLYEGRHDVFGSDHRPVQRAITIKNMYKPEYAKISKLLDADNPV